MQRGNLLGDGYGDGYGSEHGHGDGFGLLDPRTTITHNGVTYTRETIQRFAVEEEMWAK